MSDSILNISDQKSYWSASTPIIRFAIGASFIMAVTSLWNYDLSYLTAVLGIGYISPGAKPLTFKQATGFIVSLIVITGLTVGFSELFLEYSLVFFPLLILALLWLYFIDQLPAIIKVFLLISLVVIPFVSIDSGAIGSYIAINLVFNAFMAIVLTQLVFIFFPLSDADIAFEKVQNKAVKQTKEERFSYASKIVIVLIPVFLLFYIFKLSSSVLILIFVAILSMSPALANPKVGLVLIVANIMGGVFAILAYYLLTIVPNFAFMILLVFLAGLIFGQRIFSKDKLAPIFKSGFSTFLLILGSVLSSDAAAGEKVWPRVMQISLAVIYVVFAFRILSFFKPQKTAKTG